MTDYSGKMRLTRLAQQLVAQHLRVGGTAIDATVGNGHDTLFLAKTVGRDGKVYGCDIQQIALDQCWQRLAAQGVDSQVCLWRGDHARLAERIPGPQHGKINAIMFNLGYLPGTDKQVITTPDSTVKALQASLLLLSPGGILSVLAYPGHPGGQTELQAVMGWAKTLANDSFELARISHHPPTATAQWHALAGFRSVGVLDIVSTMPARTSVAKATQAAPLRRLATNGGEKCGLEVHGATGSATAPVLFSIRRR